MIRELVNFKVSLFLFLALSYLLHYFIIKQQIDPLLVKMFKLSYLGNFIITSSVFFILILFNKRQAKNLGFIFLFTSFFKFAFFYFLLQPTFQLDNITTRLEFFIFFVPYSLSLILEVRALVKTLNKA
jgi:hypothetical protein